MVSNATMHNFTCVSRAVRFGSMDGEWRCVVVGFYLRELYSLVV